MVDPVQAPASAAALPAPLYLEQGAKVAAFESEGKADGLVLSLGGGSYDITYQTAQSVDGLAAAFAGQSVYVADFNTQQETGDKRAAEVFILIGDLRLGIKAVGKDDVLLADVVNQGEHTSASFRYQNGARAPPRRRTIVVVGKIGDVVIDGASGSSTVDLRVLDLEPPGSAIHTADMTLFPLPDSHLTPRGSGADDEDAALTGLGHSRTEPAGRPPAFEPAPRATPHYTPPPTHYTPPYHPHMARP